MNAIHQLHDEIAVVGWSCRFPGANSVAELWSLLLEGQCAVSQVPADRFSLQRFGHPRRQERGRSYTWAAGVLDDLWGFDPSVFGISPREAEQMDPQQRILLQLTWEALEDAGIRPSSIAGNEVGVFVGSSLTEYGYGISGDPAVADSHFATGNSLAILSNRISYIFDLHGPSITIDTACSSSLVAVHQAVEALRSGRVETAIVGGINVIASPCSFIGFSQASMLSPTGLCRAFSAEADGFVRAEGGAVLVLRKSSLAAVNNNQVHGLILASETNSDGRTNGISLPSGEAQERLLSRIYSRAHIAADRLAFVEAHGTGTPAGDPIEANAIGRSLGQDRSQPLPIGSIKTNIGHLEAASGLAGMMKALLSLNHSILPASLHFKNPNPHIEFDRLNLAVSSKSLLLPNSRQQCAGVNSFGFGGTNAHVIVAPGRTLAQVRQPQGQIGANFTTISAATKPALQALAKKYLDRFARSSEEETALVASAAAHRRDRLSQRLVISSSSPNEVVDALQAFTQGAEHAALVSGEAVGDELPAAFIYSGNGSQWAGMGISAYKASREFQIRFDQIDQMFERIAGWSLKDTLFDETLHERLTLTRIAQPLIFAVQSSATAALRARGLSPAVVVGHSVGEVAAAEAAGILDLRTAVQVIHFRSKHQELVRGKGRMAAVMASPDVVQQLLSIAPGVAVAAFNSPRTVTVAGPGESIARLKQAAKEQGITLLDLGLDYPFHTGAMEPVEAALIADLRDVSPHEGHVPFVSTVTGSCVSGTRLVGRYWWRNVREPVQFLSAIREAAKLGAKLFVEVAPRSTLLRHISDSLDTYADGVATLSVLNGDEQEGDPFDIAVSKAIIKGARVDTTTIFGPDPGSRVALPSYPWQQQKFRFTPTSEFLRVFDGDLSPLIGGRNTNDALAWHSFIDTAVMPEFADHKVGNQVLFPGTAFLEIALNAARQWLKTEQVAIADFEILKPLDLSGGETREVMTRVSPGSNTFEIFSRPRLSHSGWLLNATGKMLHGTAADPEFRPVPPSKGTNFSEQEVYAIAQGSGLNYGPAFALVRHAVLGNGRISVELEPTQQKGAFLLDPIRLDACSHGLITLFPELRTEERGVAYIPVRLDQASLYLSGAVPQRAIIEVRSKSERSILVDYHVLTATGELIATVRGVRVVAVQAKRAETLESVALVEMPELMDGSLMSRTGISADPHQVLAEATSLGVVAPEAGLSSDAALLLEGWAAAAAFELASVLATGDVVSPDALVVDDRLPAELRPWLVNILNSLVAGELAKREQGGWVLIGDPLLPSAASLVKAISAEHPARAAELLLTAEFASLTQRIAANGGIRELPEFPSRSVLDFYELGNASIREANQVLASVFERVPGIVPSDRALRILHIGYGPMSQRLFTIFRGKNAVHSILEPDRHRSDHAQVNLAKEMNIRILEEAQGEKAESYDLIVAAEGIRRLSSKISLSNMRDQLAPGGLLIAVEPRRSLFRDLVFGLSPSNVAMESPSFGTRRTAHEWIAALTGAGFDHARSTEIRYGTESGFLIAAKSQATKAVEEDVTLQPTAPAGKSALIVGAGVRGELAQVLAQRFRARGTDVKVQPEQAELPDHLGVRIYLPRRQDDTRSPVAKLADRCMEIRACAQAIGSAEARLWLVFFGAIQAGSSKVDPIETGAWAFSRSLANEFPNLDVRRIDIASNVPVHFAAESIRDIVSSDTRETELQVEAGSIRAIRMVMLPSALQATDRPKAEAARLQRRMVAGQRLGWEPIKRQAPAQGELEIAVEATGLNFRDLMWMLGLLPDDILEDGYSGPTLGLECAGRVIAVGSSVKHFQVGDRIVCFAPSAFSTHVTIPASHVAKIPNDMSFEAAATLPVAFLTAQYSLITLAKLQRGEWVLIHSAAGGVGTAAVQIAQRRGAKIIATAGSPAKRELLRALGVEHILDSRSSNFVDQVRQITESGVDVVLNSLAGEFMERSLSCLRPFGRFVELGKRDYVSNTHVGLRPFRKNLSYFGVDVDQLISGNAGVGRKVFSDFMRQVEKHELTPLPHTVFPGAAIADAFHLLQHSWHVGKVVAQPLELAMVPAATKPWTVSSDRTHIITGAFSGFGMETAKWLADQGARHLVLMSRSGAATNDAKAAVAALTKRGVKVMAEACDVTDMAAMQTLFAKIGTTMPPVAGIMHAAMVLDDCILANLDLERLNKVLEPKVSGAENLHALTRNMPLDYFVLFSSVTTMMGNPGQANYVAANAYMEGLARRRRQDGLPALAVGWGPIIDVGVVARNQALQANLQKVSGVRGMTSREALNHLKKALEQAANSNIAVMTIVSTEGGFNADRLPVLRSPTYARMVKERGDHEDVFSKTEMRALLQEDPDAAHKKVMGIIVAQLARVLRFREEDISHIRPLTDMGLDSLMALELAITLEEAFDIHVSLASADDLTVTKLTNEVIAQVGRDDVTSEHVAASIVAERHLGEVEASKMELIEEMLSRDRKGAIEASS